MSKSTEQLIEMLEDLAEHSSSQVARLGAIKQLLELREDEPTTSEDSPLGKLYEQRDEVTTRRNNRKTAA